MTTERISNIPANNFDGKTTQQPFLEPLDLSIPENREKLRDEAIHTIRTAMISGDTDSSQVQAAKEMIRMCDEMKKEDLPDDEKIVEILPVKAVCDFCKKKMERDVE